MKHDYRIRIWEDFDEESVLEFLEETFRRLGYNVTNFHKTDRVHEDGIDLFCEKNGEEIAIQAKKKPRKDDINQFVRFVRNTRDKRAIYVYIQNPTRPFEESIRTQTHDVEFWDSDKLHEFLVENESIDYLCLYFSKHPMILSLAKVHGLILGRRKTNYTEHRFSVQEIARLWTAKDNSVKVWVSLYFVYQKWNSILMAKTEKNKKEFKSILEAISDDLDTAYNISRAKFVSSFQDLSERHPDIVGLLWKLASQRTNWAEYTGYVDRCDSLDESLFFTSYYWVCPLYNEAQKGRMSGFYSSMNYLLENFQEIAKNIENAIDWVFAEMNRGNTN